MALFHIIEPVHNGEFREGRAVGKWEERGERGRGEMTNLEHNYDSIAIHSLLHRSRGEMHGRYQRPFSLLLILSPPLPSPPSFPSSSPSSCSSS